MTNLKCPACNRIGKSLLKQSVGSITVCSACLATFIIGEHENRLANENEMGTQKAKSLLETAIWLRKIFPSLNPKDVQ